MPAAKRTLKLSPRHEPSLPEKPQPCHRKTDSPQHPGRSEVTLPHWPRLPVMGFCHLRNISNHRHLTPSSLGRDGRTHCQEAGWHHAALCKGLWPQRSPSRKTWPRGPSSLSPEGLGNTAARLWVYFHGIFSALGTQGDLQPCCSQDLSWLLGSGTEQELQLPLARSTVTSSPVRLAAPHRQPSGTPDHATNSWIKAYVLMSPLSPAGREGNRGKSKHSKYLPATSPRGTPSHRWWDSRHTSTSCPCLPSSVHP